MNRKKVSTVEEAIQDLGNIHTSPKLRERELLLPFSLLTGTEFEIFCFLLLKAENPEDEIFYYGKTGDAGRDIIWIKDDKVELIQCKNYGKNIGTSEIKMEIEKLFLNLCKRIIPHRIDSISFYVSKDFNSSALDFLNKESEWQVLIEQLASKYSTQDIQHEAWEEIINWKPALSFESGLTLTQKAQKQSRLLERFFSIQKVVDTSEIEKTNSKIDKVHEDTSQIIEMLKSGLFSIQTPQTQSADPLMNLLAKAEKDCPGVAFEAKLKPSSNEVIISVSAKPGFSGTPLCNLKFNGTTDGHRGLEKIRLFIEKGDDISLCEGEFEIEYLIPVPFKSTNRHLRLEHVRPGKDIPVRIEVWKDQSYQETISLAFLNFPKAGTKEFQLLIQGGNLAGSISGIISKNGEYDSTINFNGSSDDLKTLDAIHVKSNLELLIAISEQKPIRIYPLEKPDLAVTLGENGWPNSDGIPREFLENSYILIKNIIKINRYFGVNLRHPGYCDPLDLGCSEYLVSAIEQQEIRHGPGKDKIPISLPGLLKISDFLAQVENSNLEELPSMKNSDEIDFELLGFKTPKVEVELVFEGISFLMDSVELKDFCQNLNDESLVDLEFEYKDKVEIFKDWGVNSTQ